MAEQQGESPIAKAGTLLENDWSDYPNPQAFFNAIAEKLEISVEAGQTGATGGTGGDGSDAEAKTYGLVINKSIPIPALTTTLNTGTDLTDKIVHIRAPAGHSTTNNEAFAIGVIEQQTVHFVFAKDEANSPAVARDGWTLEIYELKEI